jgi:hypothetical protein
MKIKGQVTGHTIVLNVLTVMYTATTRLMKTFSDIFFTRLLR